MKQHPETGLTPVDAPTRATSDTATRSRTAIDEFDAGILVGILVGEGHFGGDGRQPHVTLRMHADHRALFEWLMARFPESRLYGPYDHAGRHYYQWMARGRFLRDQLLPILRERLRPEHSGRVWDRFVAMCDTYGLARPSPDREAPRETGGPAAGGAERIST